MPLGVGIIGLSAARGWAAAAHVPAVAAVPGCRLVAASASSPASARAAARRYGIAACDGPDELAAHPDVDLVVVAVKVPWHAALVGAALRAGKPVLCEWPLGNGLPEAETLARNAAAAGVRGFVGLQARSAPAVRFVADLIASGEIGEVLSTTLVGDGDRWGPTVAPETLYLVDRTLGATMLSIPVGHTLDGVCACLGEIVEVTATTAVRRPRVTRTDTGEPVTMTAEDQIAVTGRLAGGAVISLHYRGGRVPGRGLLWEICGTAGSLVITGPTGHLQYGRVAVHSARAGERELTPRPVPARYQTLAVEAGSPPHAVAHAYAAVLGDLRSGSHTAPSFAAAVERHRLLDAIEAAAASGERRSITPRPGGRSA